MAGIAAGERAYVILDRRSSLNSLYYDYTVGEVVNGAYLEIQLGVDCTVYRDAIEAAAGGLVEIVAKSTSAVVNQPQGGIPTVAQLHLLSRQDMAFRMNPEGHGTAASAVAVVLDDDDYGVYVRLDATAGEITQTLPPTVNAGGSYKTGRMVLIKEVSGINGVVVARDGDDINEVAADYYIPPGGAALFVGDYGNWNVVATSLDVNHVNNFLAAQGSQQVDLTDGTAGDPTVDVDAALGNLFVLKMTDIVGATRELQFPTNLKKGFTYMYVIVNSDVGDAVQDFTWEAAAGFFFPSGVAPTATASNDAIDVITFACCEVSIAGGTRTILVAVNQPDMQEV